ncbi:MAG: MATE family efflux transporter, partial [Clostridiaceae bacterium]|nr:MATE family efflux transporter [Clostridiaceae bacterium]
PASAEQLMFQGGRLITQTFIVSLGTVAIASNTIASSINALLIVPGSALSIAATTLVGQHIGAGRFHDARKQLSFLTAMASVTLAVTGSIVLIILNPIISFYTRDPDIHQLVWTIVLSSIIAQPFIWPTSWILPAGLRGAGDIRYTMIVAIGSMWLVRILFGYVFAIIFAWGPIGIWIAMYADWLVRSLFFSRRVHHDDWFQKVILR